MVQKKKEIGETRSMRLIDIFVTISLIGLFIVCFFFVPLIISLAILMPMLHFLGPVVGGLCYGLYLLFLFKSLSNIFKAVLGE